MSGGQSTDEGAPVTCIDDTQMCLANKGVRAGVTASGEGDYICVINI